MYRLLPIVLVALLVGCTTTRILTVTTKPPDASIRIDGVERGKGTVTDQLVFGPNAETHTVTVSRMGYKEQTIPLKKDFKPDTQNVELKYLTKRVTLNVQPVPAAISVDGRAVTTEPQDTTSVELEFTVDARSNWTTHTVTADREGYERAQQVVSWQDQQQAYTLQLQPRKKDLNILTTPQGAQIYLDDQPVGTSPVTVTARPFPVDKDTDVVVPQHIKAIKKGYPEVALKIGWDEGKSDYSIPLVARSKEVHISTTPAGGTVTIDGKELPRDANGTSTATLSFPPTDEKGELKTYTAIVAKKTADSEWYPQNLVIAYDEGKSDYPVVLKEIRTRAVAMLAPTLERGDEGWEIVPKVTPDTLAWKDVSENQKDPPAQLTRLPKGTQIDTLAVSPDGQNVLFTILYGNNKNNFRSQMIMIRADGSQGAVYLNDGKSLEITPVFTPGGEKIVFSSNRAGRRLSIWRMSATGAPGIEQLTTGDTNDLWPSIDSDPKPRLFYQASVDTRPDPRLYMTLLGTVTRTDLTMVGGSQPRVSPKNDAIIFCGINDKTGKRDLYVMSDNGGSPQNLTNTPDVDEFDPIFSKDGTKLAFVSDAGVDEDRRHNWDIWAMDLAHPDRPTQITTNGSWDDHPAWDPSGNAIYFRSNRGGDWAIWRVSTK
jgi:Tol biopolymer transport system component